MTAVMDTSAAEATFASIPLDEIIPSSDNVRFDLGDLDGLVASIASVGLIEPLAVERCVVADHADDDHRFHILAGERRWTAARRAGMTDVPCMVRDAVTDDGARAELMLIENLQRQDLQPLEEARGYQRLVDLGLSQRTIAERVGCSQAHVSRRVALLELPAAVQAKVGAKPDSGGITVADAHELLKLKDHPKDLAAAAKGGDVARAVDQRVKDIEADTKLKKLTAEAKAKGWKICKVDRSYGAKRTYWPLRKPGSYGYGVDVEVDAAKHRKEPCHGVTIEKGYNGQVNQTEVCTARDRHKPEGESSLKLPKQERRQRSDYEQKELDEAKARKAAAVRRVEALPALVARRTAADEAVAILARATLASLGYDETKVACTLLGLGQPKYRGEILRQEAAKSFEDLVRVAVAGALARGHEAARRPHRIWTGSVTDLYDYLAKRGYELDGFEQEKLAGGRKDDEEEADLLATLGTFHSSEVRVVHLNGPAGSGLWRVICDACGELDEEREVVAELAMEAEGLQRRAAHLTAAHAVRSCRVCSCTEDDACAGGCSWLFEDLCDSPSCATGVGAGPEQLEDLGVSRAVQEGVREMKDELDAEGLAETADTGGPITEGMPTITVKKAGKRWKATCSACGKIGTNTSEAYATERGQAHVDFGHRLVDAEVVV